MKEKNHPPNPLFEERGGTAVQLELGRIYCERIKRNAPPFLKGGGRGRFVGSRGICAIICL